MKEKIKQILHYMSILLNKILITFIVDYNKKKKLNNNYKKKKLQDKYFFIASSRSLPLPLYH